MAEPTEDGLALPFSEAMERRWQSDAHFACYEIVDPGKELVTWPRLTKSVVPELRRQGYEVTTRVLSFDYDTHPHALWTPKGLDEFAAKLNELHVTGHWFFTKFAAFYTTLKGARFVHVLDEPITVERAEEVHKRAVDQVLLLGLQLDTSCWDWTRLFRLPYVVRDNVPTWDTETLTINRE